MRRLVVIAVAAAGICVAIPAGAEESELVSAPVA